MCGGIGWSAGSETEQSKGRDTDNLLRELSQDDVHIRLYFEASATFAVHTSEASVILEQAWAGSRPGIPAPRDGVCIGRRWMAQAWQGPVAGRPGAYAVAAWPCPGWVSALLLEVLDEAGVGVGRGVSGVGEVVEVEGAVLGAGCDVASGGPLLGGAFVDAVGVAAAELEDAACDVGPGGGGAGVGEVVGAVGLRCRGGARCLRRGRW